MYYYFLLALSHNHQNEQKPVLKIYQYYNRRVSGTVLHKLFKEILIYLKSLNLFEIYAPAYI